MIDWLLETLLATTFLMLLVLTVRRPVATFFGAGWAYALWLVPAARIILPPLPQIFPESALPPVVIFIPTTAEATASLPAAAGPGQWVPFMLALWAGGAVIFLTLQWLAYRAFLKRLDAHSRPARPPLYGGIATLVSEIVEGPLALGLVERRIVIPSDFSRRYSADERRLAMEHELTHHRRGDIWWNVAAMLVLALNWFNPVAWVAFRAFRSDQELACDAAVAANASPAERHDYARALVKSASAPGLIAACPLHHAEQLKRRLRMMRGHRVSRVRSMGGFAAVGAFALTGFSLGGQNAAPAPEAVYVVAPSPAAAPAAAPMKLGSAVAATAPKVAPALAAAPKAKASIVPARASRIVRQAAATASPLLAAESASAPPQAPLAPKSAAHAALERLLPQLAGLAVDPEPAPAPWTAVKPREKHGHAQVVTAPRRVQRERTQVTIFAERLTAEQRAQIKEAFRRAEARSPQVDRTLRFAVLKAEIEESLAGMKFKMHAVTEGE